MKACLLGCKTATLNAQVTFVNIAVAFSALAAGEGAQKRFRTEPGIGLCLRDFWTIFACRSRRYGDGILGRFGRFPATEKQTWEASGNGKTDKNEKNANTNVFKGFGMLEY